MKFFMHYQKSVHGIFCMFWRINFFRKMLFLSLWTEKGQRVTFLIFCMKFQKHKGLKLTHDFFGGKILHWGFWTKSGLILFWIFGSPWQLAIAKAFTVAKYLLFIITSVIFIAEGSALSL